ncbi:hypothetical protein WDU94_006540 [Cyamophila willieti]
MTLFRSVNLFRPLANRQFQYLENRPFHFLGSKNQAEIFRSLTDVRKSTEPNDYFTKHGGEEVFKIGKLMTSGDEKIGADKMISLPRAPPSQKPSWVVPTGGSKLPCKSKSQMQKRVKVCSNRSGRIVVKPIRVPVIIDIQNMRHEPPRITIPPLPPPIQLTLTQRFLNLSKDAAWVAFGALKRQSLHQMRKIEPPKFDLSKLNAQKMKKIAIFGSPLVTTLIGYIYGKS